MQQHVPGQCAGPTHASLPACRFWVLETVARVPYFAFISVLHLYETLGELDAHSVASLHDDLHDVKRCSQPETG